VLISDLRHSFPLLIATKFDWKILRPHAVFWKIFSATATRVRAISQTVYLQFPYQ